MAARAEPRAGALPPLRFLTLGPLEVRRDGVPLELGPPQQRALLAALLVDAPRSVPVVTLLERLWGTGAPSTATKSVQKYVSNLRRILGVDRVVSSGGYGLVADPHEIDATAFDAALDEARGAATPSAALAVLDAAIDSWRGEPYADLVAVDFLEPVRRRAAELHATIGEERLDAFLALGAHERVIAETAELLREHPFRERLWRQRAAGLAAAGRQAEALEVLRELRGSLAEHLGIDPSPATQDLERRILAQDPTTRPVERRPGNLPAPTTDLIGRAAEVEWVLAALDESRLVTLAGPGGVGKTTLALAAARRQEPSHLAGAWLVELAPVSDPDRVARRTAEVLGVHEHPTRPIAEHLATHLADDDPLLVLDNCEHLLDAAASLIGSLLQASPGLRVLATSRQPLGVPGETIVPVEPLPVPPAGATEAELVTAYASVELLTERARRAGARVDPATTGADLAEICRRLDGIPLAIELAAARLRAFSPAELAARLGDRFALLADARHEGPGRHQTLEATIDWSFRLLEPDEQAMFVHLAVFRGGFRIEAAEAVLGDGGRDVAATIAALVDRSLLATTPTLDGRTRYRMLDTIRRFAEHRPGEDETTLRARHAAYYARLAAAVADEETLTEPERLLTLGADYENLRAALAFLLEHGEPRQALELAIALATFWNETGALTEGQRWLERALAADPTRDAAHVQALLRLSTLHQPSSSARPIETAREAMELADAIGDDRLAAQARLSLGRHHAVRLEHDLAEPLLTEALALAERSGDPLDVAECDEALGIAHRRDPDHGIPYFERAIETFRRLGADARLAHALFSMTYRSLITAGRFDEGRAALEEALALSLRHGSRHTAAHAMAGLGQIARLTGDRDGAERTFTFVLDEFRAIGDRRCTGRMLTALALIDRDGDAAWPMLLEAIELAIDVDREASPEVTETVDALVLVAFRRGDAEAAARWLGAVDAVRERYGIRRTPPDEAQVAEARDRLEGHLGPERAAALREEGASLTFAQVAEEARARPAPA